MLGGVGVAGADVLVLQRFELLLGAEFVGLVMRVSADHDRREWTGMRTMFAKRD